MGVRESVNAGVKNGSRERERERRESEEEYLVSAATVSLGGNRNTEIASERMPSPISSVKSAGSQALSKPASSCVRVCVRAYVPIQIVALFFIMFCLLN